MPQPFLFGFGFVAIIADDFPDSHHAPRRHKRHNDKIAAPNFARKSITLPGVSADIALGYVSNFSAKMIFISSRLPNLDMSSNSGKSMTAHLFSTAKSAP